MAEQKFLITGGAGFVGSHLTDRLLEAGHSVVALDNLSTGQLSNLDRAGRNPNFRFVQGSVLDELIVDELVHQCDTVVHLAAAVGVQLVVDEPLRSLTTNIRGSENVIGAAHRYRRTVLIASTSEIYGKNSAGPLREDADRILGSPSVSRWAYSTAKAVDEILANAYHRERGLPAIIVRLFNTVGPRQSPAYGMVIPRLVRQALRNEPITVFGDGKQTRCFAHVQDVVTALVGLLDEPRAIGGTYNVGHAEEISMYDLAEEIKRLTGSESTIDLIPYEQAYGDGFEDMRRRVPDTGKIRALTGWHPTQSLDSILGDTIAEARVELHQEEALGGSVR
ncbi:MAG: UDP-glucose 4-epimerase [Actinomycetota bacterium]|nr:NAD-dependent epimerase/dehydratase [Cryptosporangiaceae bacterium]MDQ1675002.1 UDP-glucose 4-epimerase [Actinomycetota bacterium]